MGSRKPRRSHHRAETDPLAEEFGARVRALRNQSGFTFDAFAEEMGRGYVSELERGRVMPTLRTLVRLAEVFEMELVDVVAMGNTLRQQLLVATRDLSAVQVRRLIRDAREMRTKATPMLLNPPPPLRRTENPAHRASDGVRGARVSIPPSKACVPAKSGAANTAVSRRRQKD
jgi:transcriptional regulator with XRE-family HTH domain